MKNGVRNLDQFLLPFAEKEYIDVKRTTRILGVSESTVMNLWAARRIEIIDYAKRKWKRVKYSSVVAFCNALREKYGIPDRRPPLAPMLRYRDEDLLPFPLDDTIDVRSVILILGYETGKPVLSMIDEGLFEAYKISTISPWRISRSSLAAFLERVHSGARGRAAEATAEQHL